MGRWTHQCITMLITTLLVKENGIMGDVFHQDIICESTTRVKVNPFENSTDEWRRRFNGGKKRKKEIKMCIKWDLKSCRAGFSIHVVIHIKATARMVLRPITGATRGGDTLFTLIHIYRCRKFRTNNGCHAAGFLFHFSFFINR